jgi:PilZ domain
MSIAMLAHGARQSLARGLEALQAADAPPALLNVAQPLAEALGVLVRIEAAPEALAPAAAEPALQALREGLRLLQLPEHFQHPAAERGMAAVAETLGMVVDIGRRLEAASKELPGAPRGAFAATAVGHSPFAPAGVSAVFPGVPTPAPKVPSPPAAATLPRAIPAPAAAAGRAIAPVGAAASPPVAADLQLRAIEAALGAHSATNFYKGLTGGDIVASGGLFVATYQVPEVGQEVLLKVSMPGGYEFEAKGVVAWTREVRMSATAPGASPGFGAQLSEITDEGRGLIQRYVRNREPLFHDDL